jgi:BirA family transcriptional regulator, biotin operon repressor / biotin---[acetyl-CoA-carboxylase] ligase
VQLSDDPQVLAAVAASTRWTAVEHHPTVTSTNDVALAALHEGAAVGLVVVADRQTAGRGRAGRRWTDDVEGRTGPGNLAVTLTLRAPELHLGLVPLATGLAVADAYAPAGAPPTLKWPNDVLLDGRKAAGILVEHHSIGADRVAGTVLLLGCGLDLDWRDVSRDATAAAWVSLAEVVGGDVDRAAVLAALLVALDHHLGEAERDPARLREGYTARCTTIGERVEAVLPGGVTLTGTALGIDETGRLELETDHDVVAVTAGDVTHLRAR